MTGAEPAETPAPAPDRYDVVMAGLRVPPEQPRARKTVRALLAAIEHFVDRGDGDRFTTAAVADLAGVSIGTAYRYFPDRVAMLDALYPTRHDAGPLLELAVEQLAQLRRLVDAYADRLDPAARDELAAVAGLGILDRYGVDLVAAVELEE